MAVANVPLLGAVAATAAAIPAGLYFSSTTAIKAELGGIDQKEIIPNWRAAEDDKDAATEYAKEKYAHYFQKYLVGVKEAAEGKNQEDNVKWWQRSYDNRYTNKKGTKGFANNITDGATLKTTCQKAYKGTLDSSNSGEISGEGSESATKYPVAEVWKYCSHYETRLETLKENAEESNSVENSIGKTEDNRKVLASTATGKNDWFWNLKQEELKKGTWDSGSSSGNKFKELSDKLKGTTPLETNDNLRKVCEDGYGKQDNDTGYPKADIFKYCSVTGAGPTNA